MPEEVDHRTAGDGIAELVAFARTLRRRGIVCGTQRVLAFCRAAATLGSEEIVDLYWAGRLTLLGSREDLTTYDDAFARHFGDLPERPRPEAPTDATEAGAVREPTVEASPTDDDGAGTVASRIEVLRRTSFDELTPSERAEADRLIARLGPLAPRRLGRRSRPARRGHTPDLVRTLRRSLRTQGEPLERVWRRRRTKPRRLVLVFDVSGSMGDYTRPLALLAHAAVRAGGLVEAFAFGTRLTRVTTALRHRDADAALRAMSEAVPDWHSGTRIGECLAELIDSPWGRRGPLRGSVVVICSDGLDRGPPERLAREMARLRLVAHAVVWVNPLKGSTDYRPLARGMAAALPHLDEFVSGHNLTSLEELARVLRKLER